MGQLLQKAFIGGFFLGGVIAYFAKPPALSLTAPHFEPLPHQIPKYPDGISLRFAMVHDVIHERFPKHGKTYYESRNRHVKSQLEQLSSNSAASRPSENYWRLMDDLAVGHVHLGEYEQAMRVMREKLARQQQLEISEGASLYPTYANLGTAMMIDALVKMSARQDATQELEESLSWVRRSIEANPMAHFGREAWQVALGDFLLDASREPNLFLETDLIGNSLKERYFAGRPYFGRATTHYVQEALETRDVEQYPRLREMILPLSQRSPTSRPSTQPALVPFDEPVLGIVGMWRYGGGANPHFSLALAETMLQVGQRHIAWSAYERTIRLLNDSFPDQQIAQKLIEHCRQRQHDIEADVREPSGRLLAAFEYDLKAGLAYQAAYQDYESKRLSAGADIDNPHFYDDFDSMHPSIASNPGEADYLLVQDADIVSICLPSAVFGAGLLTFAATSLERLKLRRR